MKIIFLLNKHNYRRFASDLYMEQLLVLNGNWADISICANIFFLEQMYAFENPSIVYWQERKNDGPGCYY